MLYRTSTWVLCTMAEGMEHTVPSRTSCTKGWVVHAWCQVHNVMCQWYSVQDTMRCMVCDAWCCQELNSAIWAFCRPNLCCELHQVSANLSSDLRAWMAHFMCPRPYPKGTAVHEVSTWRGAHTIFGLSTDRSVWSLSSWVHGGWFACEPDLAIPAGPLQAQAEETAASHQKPKRALRCSDSTYEWKQEARMWVTVTHC